MNDIHFLRDFEAPLYALDLRGEPIAWPEFDFRAKFYTRKTGRCYEAWSIDGVDHNCYRDADGRLVIVFDRHGLQPGTLEVVMMALLPNDRMPDGIEQVPLRVTTGIRLTLTVTDLPTDIHMSVQLPVYVRNYEAQLAALQKNISDYSEFEGAVGGVFDEVNRRLLQMLGREPSTPEVPENPDTPDAPIVVAQASPTAPRFLQRGMIRLGAQPGVLYRNRGGISLGGVDIREGVETRFDLSAVPPVWLEEGVVVERVGMDKARTRDFSTSFEDGTLYVMGESLQESDEAVGLVLRIDGSMPYIEKGADGIFRALAESTNISDPMLDTPDVAAFGKVEVPSDVDVAQEGLNWLIEKICGKNNVEVQYRKRRKRRRYNGSTKKYENVNDAGDAPLSMTKWRSPKNDRLLSATGKFNYRVVRFRAVNRNRKVSPWVYLSLRYVEGANQFYFIRL